MKTVFKNTTSYLTPSDMVTGRYYTPKSGNNDNIFYSFRPGYSSEIHLIMLGSSVSRPATYYVDLWQEVEATTTVVFTPVQSS